MFTLLQVDSGILINGLKSLIGKGRNRPMDIAQERRKGKGMIGSERGGAKVIGSYGMRREFVGS